MTSNIPDKFILSQFLLGTYIIIIFTPLAIDNLLQLPSARAQNAIVDDPNLDKEDVAKATNKTKAHWKRQPPQELGIILINTSP